MAGDMSFVADCQETQRRNWCSSSNIEGSTILSDSRMYKLSPWMQVECLLRDYQAVFSSRTQVSERRQHCHMV